MSLGTQINYNQVMSLNLPLYGVFAAALTPLKPDFSPHLDALPVLLDFLAQRGCHGALLLGTTGEGPSLELYDAAGQVVWQAPGKAKP